MGSEDSKRFWEEKGRENEKVKIEDDKKDGKEKREWEIIKRESQIAKFSAELSVLDCYGVDIIFR